MHERAKTIEEVLAEAAEDSEAGRDLASRRPGRAPRW